MAEIAPFRGLHYNQEKIPDLAQVVIPPYDVISPEEQQTFHERSPYNFIRLELGMPTPEDSSEDNPHTRAAAWMRQWERREFSCATLSPPSTATNWTIRQGPEQVKTRKGFICAHAARGIFLGQGAPP